MTPITFGLVVYNEERLIGRCLESIKDIAAEIIIIHDGSCQDKTLTIARTYTDRVYVHERLKGSDPHRIFILNEATNDWIFMIDADEFLSDGLKKFLSHATLDPAFGAYAFRWPLWDGQRYRTNSNYRPCLFYRPKCWMAGLHNFSVQSSAPVKKMPLVLHHQPEENKVSWRRFEGQLAERINRDANGLRQPFETLETFNGQLIPPQFIKAYHAYQLHPARYACVKALHHFFGSLHNTWRDGYYGIVVSYQAGLYQYKLARRLHSLAGEQKRYS